MKDSTPKMVVILLLALWGCVSAQQYPGQVQFWAGQPAQQQQPYQQPFQPTQQQQQHQPAGQPSAGLNGLQQQQQPLGGLNGLQQQQPLGGRNGLQQQQTGLNGLQQQQPLGGLNGFRPQQDQQGVFGQNAPDSQQQQQQQQQHLGFRQGLQPQQQQQQQPFGSRPPYSGDERLAENTPAAASAGRPPFQSSLFSSGQGPLGPGQAAPGAPNASGDNNASGAGPRQNDGGNVLELEPHGAAKQPQPGVPDSQVFHSTGAGADQALYAVDWSYPRARDAPASLLLKRWGGLSPPEYVAVYRLRGPAGPPAAPLSGSPSYSLAHDELRHYPWDAARRHGAPRWRTAPRDEDFELLPANLGHHGGNHQYMYRTM